MSQISINVDVPGISLLSNTDFSGRLTTQQGLTDEIHGSDTQLEVNLLTFNPDLPVTDPNRITNRTRLGELLVFNDTDTSVQITSAVAARLRANPITGFIVDTETNDANTIDLRLADLSVTQSQGFEIRTRDITTGEFVSTNVTGSAIVTGSISAGNRGGNPVSDDNRLTVDASGNAEIFNNERPWPTDEFNDARTFVVMARPNSNTLTAADIGFTFNGTNYISFFERTQLDMAEVVDSMETKHMKSMYIQSQAVAGGNDANFDVKVRATNTPADIPDLTLTRDANGMVINTDNQSQQAVTFNTAEDYKSDVRITGRYISYRIEDNGANGWSIPTLELELDIAGRR